jgi:hypothetical protein
MRGLSRKFYSPLSRLMKLRERAFLFFHYPVEDNLYFRPPPAFEAQLALSSLRRLC